MSEMPNPFSVKLLLDHSIALAGYIVKGIVVLTMRTKTKIPQHFYIIFFKA